MKNILLCSSGDFAIDRGLPIILKKSPRKTKISYITTAAKGVSNKSYVQEYIEKTHNAGYQVAEIDIEGKQEKELKTLLKGKDVIYVEGGNTFYLIKCVRESGFDRVVRELVEQGVPYIGVSAGAYIACPTIEMAMWKRPLKYDRYGVTDFTGLGLVPFLVSVHYHPKYKEVLRKHISRCQYPVRVLTDKQAVLVRDGKTELIADGEEIKL